MLKMLKLVFGALKYFLASVSAALFYLATGIAIISFFLIATIIDAAFTVLFLDKGNIEALLASVDRRLFYRVQAIRAYVLSWRVKLTLSRLRKQGLIGQSAVLEVPDSLGTVQLTIEPQQNDTDIESALPTKTPQGRGPVWH